MLKNSVLKDQMIKCPLSAQGQMRPNNKARKKTLLMTLALTSLVDAFSILVIYLLVHTTASTQTLNVDKQIRLPMASETEALETNVTIVKIVDGKYFLDDKPIRLNQLANRLSNLESIKTANSSGERPKIIIQADKEVSFASLNPILLASSEVGFVQIKFAVLSEESI